jgi:PKHD-type hydroxylase
MDRPCGRVPMRTITPAIVAPASGEPTSFRMIAAALRLLALLLLFARWPAATADEDGQSCSAHDDCARDAYCTKNSECAKCEDEDERLCSMWRDSIDGSCARCDSEPPARPVQRVQASYLDVAVEDDRPLPPMTVNDGKTHVVFSGALTPAECASVVEASRSIAAKGGMVGSGTSADASTRRSEIRWLAREEDSPLAWVYPRVIRMMLAANEEVWGYAPTELENIQIGTYTAEAAGYYDWHVDRSTTASSGAGSGSDRVLSGSLQLTNGELYEGGALQLGALIAPRELGSLVIFPSYAMHSVRPVTKGVRTSLVLWLKGRPNDSIGFEEDAIASHISAIRMLAPHEPPEMQVRAPLCYAAFRTALLSRNLLCWPAVMCGIIDIMWDQVLLGESLLKQQRTAEALTATRRAIGLHASVDGSTTASRARAHYNAGVILSKLQTQGTYYNRTRHNVPI